MKKICLLFVILCLGLPVQAAENQVTYKVDNALYEGFFIRPAPGAPLVILIHDWDGLGAYEIRRAHMLADQGYAVFAADMFGKGIRPEQIAERRRLTGELYQDRDRMRRLLQGALDAAETQGGDLKNAVALEQHGVAHEMITYGGAPHAFSVFGTDRYREDADQKSWQRFLNYLDQTLAGR